MREKYLNAVRAYCVGHLEKHKANIENILTNGVGVADHPDIIETIGAEVANVAKYDEMLEMLDKHF
jgi:hypothetical protein